MSSMSKQVVRCRCCGHQILAREIMRTDLYERAPGQTYIYVKFRCRRCKRLGQTFVPEAQWDWRSLEPTRDELNDGERERLIQAGPISDNEFFDFHQKLKELETLDTLDETQGFQKPPQIPIADKENRTSIRFELKPERKEEGRDGRDAKRETPKMEAPKHDASRHEPNSRDNGNRDTPLNTNGDSRPEEFNGTA